MDIKNSVSNTDVKVNPVEDKIDILSSTSSSSSSSTNIKATEEKVPTVKIRLTKPHIHEGVEYEKGDFVEVDESSAEYILETADAGVKV